MKKKSIIYSKLVDAGEKTPYLCLLIIGIFYFVIMLLMGIDRHWSFKTSISDTGVYDQAIWQYLKDGLPLVTVERSTTPYNWLGFHFNPILLIIFVPLYALYPGPEWLILVQAAAISLTIFPIYHCAIHLKYTSTQALSASLVFLLNPFVIGAVQWDFHTVSIATPIIAWSIYYLLTNNIKKIVFCLALILLTQEQFGIYVACMGIAYFLLYKDLKIASCFVALGLLYTFLLFHIWFPAFSPTGTHIMLGSEMKSLSRYSWLGQTLSEVVAHFLSSPISILKKVMIELEGYRYIILLLLPFGFIFPLLGYEILLLGSADYAANALSLLNLQRSFLSYHSITLIPPIIIAALLGAQRFFRIFPGDRAKRWAALSTAMAFGLLLAISLPALLGKDSLWLLSPFPTKDTGLAEVKAVIPETAALSAQKNIAPHFSQRKFLYSFPFTDTAEYVLLRLEDPNGLEYDDSFRFIHHNGMNQHDYLQTVKCTLAEKGFKVFYFKAPWLVLKKTTKPVDESQGDSAKSYIAMLERRWQANSLSTESNGTRPNKDDLTCGL